MNKLSKSISIFGSTGSIGCNSLTVVDNLISNGHNIEIKYLTTNSNIDLLASQVKKYSPSGIVILNKDALEKFQSQYQFPKLEILSGKGGLMEIAGRNDHKLLINALVGFSGLEPTVCAIKSGKDIALANKETLVVAGKIITDLTKKFNTNLFPIDSEHSAILQCLIGEDLKYVRKLILTASGGPFLNKSIDEMRNCTVEDALTHPNWKMGKKITIDSATMMNKGLELIEARWLFDIKSENLEVIIHPESIIHSMVEFIDGSIKAQLGIPDMKIPIQYSLTYPNRVSADYPKMDFKKINTLRFEEPDVIKFECLKIAYEVLKEEGTFPAVMNAANEVAVDLFLNGKIRFYEIPEIIESQLNKHKSISDISLEGLIELDNQTRLEIINNFN